MAKTAQISDIDYSIAEMETRVARFKAQKSSDKAFIDTRILGHEREIYSIFGGGVVARAAGLVLDDDGNLLEVPPS